MVGFLLWKSPLLLAQLADEVWVYKNVRDVYPHAASKGQPLGTGKRHQVGKVRGTIFLDCNDRGG
jgi:hypothetical protein